MSTFGSLKKLNWLVTCSISQFSMKTTEERDETSRFKGLEGLDQFVFRINLAG